MPSQKTLYLMYHELERPGRDLCQTEAGYLRYVVRETDFRAHLAWLRAAGFHGTSVTEAWAEEDRRRRIAITIDDGCESDLLIAAPLLKAAEFNATFYVVAGFVGRRGYLSVSQLLELDRLGFEIGCHSMTHQYLTVLPTESLRVEIWDSKSCLEDLLGKRVDHFSCPGGRWDQRVALVAEDAGYCSVATSRSGVNSSGDQFSLARVAILRNTPLAQFANICHAQALVPRRVRETILQLAKTVLSDARYDRWRSKALRRVAREGW